MSEGDDLPATRTASCGCGSLQVRCAGEPMLVSLCHCLACQKRTGSAFGVAALFPVEVVELSGPSQTYTRPGDSGSDVEFHFCPVCGSTVYWLPYRRPGVCAVAVGAFTDPAFPAPTQATYGQHKHFWAAPDVPRQ